MQSLHAWCFLVGSIAVAWVSSSKDEPTPSHKKQDLAQDETYAEEQHPLNMKMGVSQAKKADDATTYETLVKEAKHAVAESKRVCGGKNEVGYHRRRLLQHSPNLNTVQLSLNQQEYDYNQLFFGLTCYVRDFIPGEGRYPDKLKWVVLTDGDPGKNRMDFLFAPEDRTFDVHPGTSHYVTVTYNNTFAAGLYEENVFRPGSADYTMTGTVFEFNGKVISVSFGDSFLKLEVSFPPGPIELCQKLYFLFQKDVRFSKYN